MGIFLKWFVGGLIGSMTGAAVAWFSCGTVSYLIDPKPEMVHPFYFAANMGAIAGAAIGFLMGAIYAVIKSSDPSERSAGTRAPD